MPHKNDTFCQNSLLQSTFSNIPYSLLCVTVHVFDVCFFIRCFKRQILTSNVCLSLKLVANVMRLSHSPVITLELPLRCENYESARQRSVRSLTTIWWRIGNSKGRVRVAMTYLDRQTLATVLCMHKTNAKVWRSDYGAVLSPWQRKASDMSVWLT